MKLFLDNIRGFNKCFIDINQVNFLVGENSTGKSSFLSILSLFSDPQFNFSGEFRNSFVNFGLFEDIVNKNSSNQTTFSIGLVKNGKSALLGRRFNYDSLFLIFNEMNEFPSINTIICRAKTSCLKVEISRSEIKYFLYSIKSSSDYPDEKLFLDLIDNKKFDNKNLLDKGNINIKGIQGELIAYIIRSVGDLPFLFPFRDDNKTQHEIEKKRKLYSDFGGQERFFEREKNLLENTTWIGPIRTEPQPLYQPTDKQYSAEGEHIPTILRDIFDKKESMASKRIIKLLESFGKVSGLFDKISISKLQKHKKTSPFDINVSLQKKTLKISNVGYGISQILPILTEIARSPKDSIFLVQQPEIHLHPRSQAFFGEFLFTQFKEENKSFFIETHSDFVIDRFKLQLRKLNNNGIHKKINFLFFESDNKGNTVKTIEIDKNGEYGEKQPENFRNFFLKEELDLLGFSD